MRGFAIESEVRHSCRVHARLLDAFIEMTSAELQNHNSSAFVAESLQELLETLRSERKAYGALGGMVVVTGPAIENAA